MDIVPYNQAAVPSLGKQAETAASKLVLRRWPQKRVSLRDVAGKAGVGTATASTVISGTHSSTRVSAGTRERVLKTAKELGYHPNAMARSLAGHPTKTLGVIFGLERASVAAANPYAFTVFQGLVAGAADFGYNVMLITKPWHSMERSAGILRDGRTDGLMLIAVATNADIAACLAHTGLPAVAISSGAGYDIPLVDVDNAAGARLAAEHLLALGHRRIAFLPGDGNLTSTLERQAAFLAALPEGNLGTSSGYLFPGSYEAASGYERTRQLLALPSPPTAIFAANDILAAAAIHAAQERGVAVPEQLSVIGFDDLPASSMMSPSLTTIRQPLTEIGKTGSHMLISLIETGHASQPRRHLFAPEIIVRNSTAPLQARGHLRLSL